MINLLKVRWAARMCRVLSLSPILETLCVCLRVPPGDEGNQNWTIERCSWSGMQPVYIHQRALWGGDDVHNAGSNQLGCLSSQIKWTAHSVRATLWDRWEDLCQPVPGEERGSMKPIESYIILVAARPINCFREFWISQILARLTQMGLGLHVEENALVHLMVTFI